MAFGGKLQCVCLGDMPSCEPDSLLFGGGEQADLLLFGCMAMSSEVGGNVALSLVAWQFARELPLGLGGMFALRPVDAPSACR